MFSRKKIFSAHLVDISMNKNYDVIFNEKDRLYGAVRCGVL